MKWIKRIALTLAALYLLTATLLYFNQEALIFHPRAQGANYSYGEYPEEWVELPDGKRLHALHLREGGKGVILYLHGNVGNNGRSLYQTRDLHDLGYDLFLVDYRGFGKSEGEVASEAHMTADLQVVYDRLKGEYGEDGIILAGYSLGSGPASYLAANNSPRGVVLVAPYTSLTDMKDLLFPFIPSFLMEYRLDNRANLAASRVPVRILHGVEDELIPVEMARELSALDPDRIKLTELKGKGHRAAILTRRFGEAVKDLVD